MDIERLDITDAEEWKRWRARDITASVVGALFNAHPYVTPLRLWQAKANATLMESDAPEAVLRRGRWMEGVFPVAVGERRPGWTLTQPRAYFRDPGLRLGCTPDFFIDGDARGLGVLQAKTVAPSIYRSQWASGDDVPTWIALQALTEMHLTGAAFAAIAVLVVDPFSMELVVHEFPPHDAAWQRIVSGTVQFWADVANGHAPDPDFIRDDAIIRAMHPQEIHGRTADLSGNNRVAVMLAERARLKALSAAYDAVCDEIESELRHLMQDAEIATGVPGFHITYKTVTRKAYSVPEKSTRQLRIYDKRPPDERPAMEV